LDKDDGGISLIRNLLQIFVQAVITKSGHNDGTAIIDDLFVGHIEIAYLAKLHDSCVVLDFTGGGRLESIDLEKGTHLKENNGLGTVFFNMGLGQLQIVKINTGFGRRHFDFALFLFHGFSICCFGYDLSI